MIGVYDVHTIVVAVGKLNTEPLLIASQDVPKKDVPASLVGNSQIIPFKVLIPTELAKV